MEDAAAVESGGVVADDAADGDAAVGGRQLEPEAVGRLSCFADLDRFLGGDEGVVDNLGSAGGPIFTKELDLGVADGISALPGLLAKIVW